MKTNRIARWSLKVRSISLVVALVGMVGVAFFLGESLGARVGQTTTPTTEIAPPFTVGIGDLLAAAH